MSERTTAAIEQEARAVLAELRADWASLKKAIDPVLSMVSEVTYEQIDARIAAIDRRLGGSEP